MAHEGEAAGSPLHGITGDALIRQAAAAIEAGRLDAAERLVRFRLRDEPNDPAARLILGEIAWARGRVADALAVLRGVLRRTPDFAAARLAYARMLARLNRLPEALAEATTLAEGAPDQVDYGLLKASLLVRIGDQAGAISVYEGIVTHDPAPARIWLALGHARKAIGRSGEAVAAYRASIGLEPGLGEAWWSLANLKTMRFDAADIAAMAAALDGPVGEDDRLHLHFALGKALEDAGENARASSHYAEGNRLRRGQLPYDAKETTARCAAQAAVIDRTFMAARAGGGCDRDDPIFIVGMPRSGSTLVEQILASHSMIEGTAELPDLLMMATGIVNRAAQSRGGTDYAAALAALSAEERSRLGQEYLERTRAYRRTDKPFFTDKMPNNWEHVGLIRLILPRARIIDVRRDPIACCFSAWKQHFARGQAFSYGLEDVGLYYRDYVRLMATFDEAMPGAIYRLVYERLVTDLRTEVESLLAHLGLPFEDACLTFWQTERSVRTASSEQVRMPIFDATDRARRFRLWLDPLVDALGPLAKDEPPPI